MIDYETLVQTLADWKAGVRPHAPTPPPAPAASVASGEPEQYEEVDSGVVDVGEDGQPQYEAEAEEDWSQEE